MNARGDEAGGIVSLKVGTPPSGFAIQDCVAGIYFAGLGTWTASPQSALVFSTEQEAEVFARNQRLQNVRVVRRT